MSAPTSTRAVEFNSDMTLVAFFSEELQKILPRYESIAGSKPVEVSSAYPKDLTKFEKPSIIVQRMHNVNKSMSMGNVLGIYHDSDDNADYEVSGMSNNMVYQIVVYHESKSSCSIMADTILQILHNIQIADNPLILPLYDFIGGYDSPTIVGEIKVIGQIDVTDSASNKNNDYVKLITVRLNLIQTIVPTQEFVDLAKWFRITSTITL